MRYSFILVMLMMAACTTAQDRYCAVQKDTALCVQKYNIEEKHFHTDEAACLSNAKNAIPDYIYDHPHFEQEDFLDSHDMLRSQNVLVEDDFFNNAPLDKDRRTFMTTCMHGKGWKNDHWEDQVHN